MYCIEERKAIWEGNGGSKGRGLFILQLDKAKWLQGNWQLPRHWQEELGFDLLHWQQNSGIVRCL